MRNRLNQHFRTARTRLRGRIAYPLHDHEFGEVFWVDEGRCLQVVNDVEMELGVGDFFFIRPSDCHSFHSIRGAAFSLINTCFQWHHFANLQSRYFPGDPRVYGESRKLPKRLKLSPAQLQWGRATFLNLLKDPNSAFHIERFLMNLITELGTYHEEESMLDERAPDWLHDAWQRMRSGGHLEEGVRAFYRLCGRSAEHVSREFRRHSGRTITSSVAALRMKHAAALLAGTTCDILDVSLACGFQSHSHFYASFRSAFETTPRQYRLRAAQRLH